jgi:hypothetical protein
MKPSNPSSSINCCGLLSTLAVLLALSETVAVRAVTALIFCFAAGAIEPARAAGSAADVDAARLVGADQDPANWMTYGRTYSEQRFSPLAKITADNANLLSLPRGHASIDHVAAPPDAKLAGHFGIVRP